ncbi:hypothetical protein AALP_AA7G247200 [Arabis alpina]|uniref:Uncharacterized protein n=1 Tax=Arabis alpina TaxID=50452 RepID=A0A087GKC3_ARAAL|nr:hypothetical protein AALP_AA7G247200 [Arabis alpina]
MFTINCLLCLQYSDLAERDRTMLYITDVCLPLISSGESSLSARVLINYELPTKKETYTRRITTCLASGGIVINMVVGGEVTTLKSLEESSGIIIAEMPINVYILESINEKTRTLYYFLSLNLKGASNVAFFFLQISEIL